MEKPSYIPDRLFIPLSADGSSRRAVRAVLALLYGVMRTPGSPNSQFFLNCQQFRLPIPKIYCYAGNRLIQYKQPAAAFRSVVTEIGNEIWSVWQANPNCFHFHPTRTGSPRSRPEFETMFQYEIVDANTASVVSGSLGIPVVALTAGSRTIAGKNVVVNQAQLDKQQPNTDKQQPNTIELSAAIE